MGKKALRESGPPADFLRSSEAAAGINYTAGVGRVLLIAAVGICFYLAFTATAGAEPAGCGEGSGCNSVLGSKWARILGLPLGIAGAFLYALMFLASIFRDWEKRRLFFLLLITGGALWFTAIQAVVLKSFCPWCCTAHILAVSGALLIHFGMRSRASVSASPPLLPMTAAAAAVAGLAAFQILAPEPMPVTASGTTVSTSAGKAAPGGRRFVEIHGKFRIPVEDCVSLGDAAKAEFVAVGLFDYSCKHCRETQKLLLPIVSSYGGRLAILKLPGYFDGNGREIHRMMLPLQKTDPPLHGEISEQLYTGILAAEAPLVKALLETRMGTHRLARMLAEGGPHADELLRETREIAVINKTITKSGRLPQLIAGHYVEAGANDNPAHYHKVFADNFGLTPEERPWMVCDPASLDFGRAIAMGEKTAVITLTNRGGRPITLGPPQRPKGLTISDAPQKLEAGQTAPMTVRLHVPQVPDGRSDSFFVIRSDASEPEIRVPVRVEVWNPLRTDPATLDFGDVAPGMESPARVLTLHVKAPVKIGEVTASLPDFIVESTEETSGGKEFRFRLKSFPTGAKGYRSGYLNIPLSPLAASSTDGTWPKQWRVPLRARVFPPAPSSLSAPRTLVPPATR